MSWAKWGTSKISGPKESLEPANVTVDDKILADVIKDFEVRRLSWIVQWGVNATTCILIRGPRRKSRQTHRKRRRRPEDKPEITEITVLLQTKESGWPPGGGRGEGWFSLGVSRGSTAPATSWFWPSETHVALLVLA